MVDCGGKLRNAARESRLAALTVSEAPEATASLADAMDVRATLTRLSGRQREIVVSFYFLDQSVESIARELAVPEGTVKATLHRARSVLATLLADRSSLPHEAQS